MRWIMRFLGTRYGSAIALVAVLAMVVLAFRGVSGTRDGSSVAPALQSTPTTNAEQDQDGDGHDGVVEEPSTEATTSVTAPPMTEAEAVATQFTEAWLRHDGVTNEQWLAGVTPFITDSLAESLAGADPASVPAETTVGDMAIASESALLATATTALNSGTLQLTLVVTDGSWKVNGIDWDRPT